MKFGRYSFARLHCRFRRSAVTLFCSVLFALGLLGNFPFARADRQLVGNYLVALSRTRSKFKNLVFTRACLLCKASALLGALCTRAA